MQKQHEGSVATSSGDIVQAYAGALGKAQSENGESLLDLNHPALCRPRFGFNHFALCSTPSGPASEAARPSQP